MSYEPDPPTDTQVESEAEERWWERQGPCCEHSRVFHTGEWCLYVDPITPNIPCDCKGTDQQQIARTEP